MRPEYAGKVVVIGNAHQLAHAGDRQVRRAQQPLRLGQAPPLQQAQHRLALLLGRRAQPGPADAQLVGDVRDGHALGVVRADIGNQPLIYAGGRRLRQALEPYVRRAALQDMPVGLQLLDRAAAQAHKRLAQAVRVAVPGRERAPRPLPLLLRVCLPVQDLAEEEVRGHLPALRNRDDGVQQPRVAAADVHSAAARDAARQARVAALAAAQPLLAGADGLAEGRGVDAGIDYAEVGRQDGKPHPGHQAQAAEQPSEFLKIDSCLHTLSP